MCCASAALPPLPQIRIFFPFFSAWHIRSAARWIAGKPLLSSSFITRKCSAKVSDAMLLVSESVMCVDLRLSDKLQFVAGCGNGFFQWPRQTEVCRTTFGDAYLLAGILHYKTWSLLALPAVPM